MLDQKLIMLSDDDGRHDALADAFETRCPPSALGNYVRVLKANEVNQSGQAARRERIAALQAKRRDWSFQVQSVQKELDRENKVHPSELKAYESNKKKIASADKELASLRKATPTPSLPAETLGDFLLETPGKFVAVAVEAKLQKGQTALEALEASRANREALIRRRVEIGKEPLPFETALARLKADVHANARGPDLTPITKMRPQHREHAMANTRRPDLQGHVDWPTQGETFEGGRHGEFERGISFLCWLDPAAIIERGTAELKALYAGRKGLSAADRARLLAEVESEILDEERREESFLRMCEDANLPVVRRPLANPLAVLGIKPA